MSDDLFSRLSKHPICVVDVGARGGLQPHWERLRQYSLFVGFEPDAEECARLTNAAAAGDRYLEIALHRTTGMATLYHCLDPNRTSLYQPNKRAIEAIYGSVGTFEVASHTALAVHALDDLVAGAQLPAADFIKLDTQGSELDILRGAAKTLQSTTLGIEVEVEFEELYQGQPLFADVEAFMRGLGFQFFGFRTLTRRSDIVFGQSGKTGYRGVMHLLTAWAGRLLPPSGTLVSASRPIYADALFFRSADQYAASAVDRQQSEALVRVIKAIVVTTEFRFYEYGFDVISHALAARLISQDVATRLRAYIRKQSRSPQPAVSALKRRTTRVLERLASPRRAR